MTTVGSVFRRVSSTIAIVLTGLLGMQHAHAQLGAGDIVLGRSESSDSFRVYDAVSGTWSPGPGWTPAFIQSVEFDNSDGFSHNASGNLFGANFGSSFEGFQVHNLATDGSNNSELTWSIVEATGGTIGTDPSTVEGDWLTQRGGGVSFSPDNSYMAWTNYDTAQIFVHDYSAGAAFGTGSGATVSGARVTGLGDGNGNSGSLTALAPSVTQGTTWLNNTTLVAFDGFGELITLDVSGVAGGTEDGTLAGWQPTEMTNWKIANSEVMVNAQYTDVEYNPEIDPDHIYAALTRNSAPYDCSLYAFDYNTSTGAISLNNKIDVPNDAVNDQPRESREIALDANGNLFYSGYAGSGGDNIIMELPNATTTIASWNEANVAVFYTSTDYTGFNGMDVAFSDSSPGTGGLLGDYNEDNVINAADYTVWRNALGGGTIPNDPTGGVATQEDYDYWKVNFGATLELGAGASSAVSVPEPGALTLLLLLMTASIVGLPRRTACEM